jgi:hypothetical protein
MVVLYRKNPRKKLQRSEDWFTTGFELWYCSQKKIKIFLRLPISTTIGLVLLLSSSSAYSSLYILRTIKLQTKSPNHLLNNKMSLLNQPLPMAPKFPVLLQNDIIHLDQDHILVKDCSCPICQEPYLDGERPVQIRNTSRCDHVFGLTCLRKWLEMNNTCPMCRTALYARTEPTPPQRHGTIGGLWTPNMGDLMTGAEIEYLFGPSSMASSTAGNRRQMARNRPGLGERRLSGETLVGARKRGR